MQIQTICKNGCSSKRWIYFLLIPIFFFFFTAHYAFNAVLQKHHLEALFSINKSYVHVHSKGSTDYKSQLKLKLETGLNNSSNLSDTYYSKRNISKLCPKTPSNLVGKVQLIKKATSSFKSLMDKFENSSLQNDGRYQPSECRARYLVAIIVPYRNRLEHLNYFFTKYSSIFTKTAVRLYNFHRRASSPFNRGMLMNVGFTEARKIRPFDCFIFHDVDLLPEDDRNLYTCPKLPRHMSVAIDVFEYKLPYVDIFGGVSAMSNEHFLLVNGFSNMFWGWGGEDDDISMRIRMKGLHISRYSSEIARYTMLTHEKQKPNPDRYKTLNQGPERFKTEGLNSLKYKRLALQSCKLFTWIFVELAPPNQDDSLSNVIKNLYTTPNL